MVSSTHTHLDVVHVHTAWPLLTVLSSLPMQWQWEIVISGCNIRVHCDDVTGHWPRLVLSFSSDRDTHPCQSIPLSFFITLTLPPGGARYTDTGAYVCVGGGADEANNELVFTIFGDCLVRGETQRQESRARMARETLADSLASGGSEENSLDSFPEELLVRICSYIPARQRQRLRGVCRSLRRALDSPPLWRTLTIDGFDRSDYGRLAEMLGHRGEAVKRVSISGSFNLVGLARDLCTCSRLKSLRLTQSPCFVTNMASVVRALPCLERLQFRPVNTACGLGHCTHVMCRAVEWQEFLAAVEGLSSLTLLSQWDENFVEFLLRQWACLRYRPLSVTVSTMQTQAAQPPESVQTRYSSLQDLWKECMENFPPCEEACQFRVTWQSSELGVNDVPLFELNLDGSPLSLSTALSYTHPEGSDPASSMHGMITLSAQQQNPNDSTNETTEEIFSCGRFISSPEFMLTETETRFVSFNEATAHLTSISMTEATALTSANLEILALHCPQLDQLNLSSCKKCLNPLLGLAALASHCPQLRALNIQNIPCNYVERTSELWLCLSRMTGLRHLAIDPCLLQPSQEADEFTGEQYLVSDEQEIEESLKTMQYIHTLEIQTALTPSKTITCPQCRNMDGHRLELVGHMTSLRTLHIKEVSPTVCDRLLSTVASNCKYLKNLSINMEFSFTLPLDLGQSSVRKLLIRCPRFNITDKLTEALVRAPLTHVYLTVRSVTRGAISMLLQDLPELVVCHIYCRDGPVMKPPGEILEFRQTMQEMSSRGSNTHPLDFAFNEGRLYKSETECNTTQSMMQTELVSWWN